MILNCGAKDLKKTFGYITTFKPHLKITLYNNYRYKTRNKMIDNYREVIKSLVLRY